MVVALEHMLDAFLSETVGEKLDAGFMTVR